jgi:hypothetical protein
MNDEELASAYLDGEATADEVARVERDPELLARVEQLRTVHLLVAAPVPARGPAERDRAIAAALDARPTGAVVDLLAAARARRRLRVLSVAAAIVLAVGAFGILVRSSSETSHDTAAAPVSGADTTAANKEAIPQAAGDAGGAGGVSTANATASASAAPFLGSFATTDDLVAAVRSNASFAARSEAPADQAAPPAGATSGTTTFPICKVVADLTFAGQAELAGAPVTVLVFGDPPRVEIDDASCNTILNQEL